MEFKRNIIAYGVTHSISESRSISGRRNFSGGEKRQPSFFYLLPRASEKKRILCFDWLCDDFCLILSTDLI